MKNIRFQITDEIERIMKNAIGMNVFFGKDTIGKIDSVDRNEATILISDDKIMDELRHPVNNVSIGHKVDNFTGEIEEDFNTGK